MPTPNENIVTEEEKQDNDRFQELNKKPDTERTEEEKQELGELKERYGQRMQKKIDKLHWEAKTAQEKAEEAERRAQEAEERARKAEEGKVITSFKDEYIEIGGKKYLTNRALEAKIKTGDISQQEAEEYAIERDSEKIAVRVESKREQKQREQVDKETRIQDMLEILKDHPEFDPKHPNHNPDDPLFKTANEIYREGYGSNPRGLSLALKRAKQILRISDTSIDRSSHFSVESSLPSDRGGNNTDKEVTLTAEEQDAAIRQWTRGDVTNPKTGRAYTPQEALAKGLEAKKRRIR
mgnify:CR=1 FL=1